MGQEEEEERRQPVRLGGESRQQRDRRGRAPVVQVLNAVEPSRLKWRLVGNTQHLTLTWFQVFAFKLSQRVLDTPRWIPRTASAST